MGFCVICVRTGLVEGRFAPKATVAKNLWLLSTITAGYADYNGDGGFNLFSRESIQNQHNPHLNLTAHFIKKEDSKEASFLKVRHHDLRIDIARQARALVAARAHSRFLIRHLVGADAAANELHAPPEVLAPIFRYLKRQGFTNFTYHVGEDFIHLLSGIRAIYEALFFLDLSGGSRIGHGTAVGLDPGFWLEKMNDGVVISRGEWLDNMVFLYLMLQKRSDSNFNMEKLRHEIELHAEKVYGRNFSTPFLLVQAYQMRMLDPLIACNGFQRENEALDMTDWVEWAMIDKQKKKSPNGFLLFLMHHSKPCIDRAREKIEVSSDHIANEQLLNDLQQWVVEEIILRDVAIESMPTSNLRISFYDKYSQHHLWRWLGLRKNSFKVNPSVCLATDDPGIFSTNIRNEYTHVYEQLIYQRNLSGPEAQWFLTQLIENSKAYMFRTDR